MSWSFKFVGNVQGLIQALEKGGGQFDAASGRFLVPPSYTRACSEIVNHLTLQSQALEIGWQVEVWGGGHSYHIDIQPVNLRMADAPAPPIGGKGKPRTEEGFNE